MMKTFIKFFIASLVIFSTTGHANCRKSMPDALGSYSVQCDDGNQYRVQKNEILGTTKIEGSNPYNNSNWNQEVTNNGITSPTMRGTDKKGNPYNCTMNQLTKQWQCY